MNKHLIAVLFFLFALKGYGQSFYAVTSDSQIKKITINNGVISEQDINSCIANISVASIAIYQNTFYYSIGSQLIAASISGNNFTNCFSPQVTMPSNNALTCDEYGVLYAAGSNMLYSINTRTGVVTLLGTMPYSSAGDVIFYKGGLYMASTSGIVKINVTNPARSTLIIPGLANVFGMAAVSYSTAPNKVYALSVNGSNTDIFELDLDNNVLGAKIGTLPYIVYDAASVAEDGGSGALGETFFPNTFTPNGDGINDIFGPYQGSRTDIKFSIYNRYGKLIFNSASSKNGWDGRYNGREVPAGVYYWVANYINIEGRTLTMAGYVTLIR
ncbi:MAG TPA: gliding motility-associated C-terminal domain-containing protein [Mucilaginibacter sp.]|jgi:gliding motility-associated-like protein|nr:gliding motility-associated C-terminal domain-containing protein [Mucilaginibacter sp.]